MPLFRCCHAAGFQHYAAWCCFHIVLPPLIFLPLIFASHYAAAIAITPLTLFAIFRTSMPLMPFFGWYFFFFFDLHCLSRFASLFRRHYYDYFAFCFRAIFAMPLSFSLPCPLSSLSLSFDFHCFHFAIFSFLIAFRYYVISITPVTPMIFQHFHFCRYFIFITSRHFYFHYGHWFSPFRHWATASHFRCRHCFYYFSMPLSSCHYFDCHFHSSFRHSSAEDFAVCHFFFEFVDASILLRHIFDYLSVAIIIRVISDIDYDCFIFRFRFLCFFLRLSFFIDMSSLFLSSHFFQFIIFFFARFSFRHCFRCLSLMSCFRHWYAIITPLAATPLAITLTLSMPITLIRRLRRHCRHFSPFHFIAMPVSPHFRAVISVYACIIAISIAADAFAMPAEAFQPFRHAARACTWFSRRHFHITTDTPFSLMIFHISHFGHFHYDYFACYY